MKPRVELLEDRLLLKSYTEAPALGAPPPPSASVIWVDTVAELQSAVSNLQSNQTIVIESGAYTLTQTLYLPNGANAVTNVLIRGETENFSDVVIRGPGMNNSAIPHGFWIGNCRDVTIANLTIGEVYYHPIQIDGNAGADRIHVYHCRLYDAGEQFIKSAGGADDCSVKYSVIEYTVAPPTVDHGGGTGYTNGIDVHDGDNWVIQHNLIRNFHTPDNADNLWNPAILMWNGARNTLVEGNTIIDTDRAIAFGLYDQSNPDNHYGGVIRNNFIYMRPGLFSANRDNSGDAPVIIWDSRDTKVYHNTIITNGNHYAGVEFRFNTSGSEARNNLMDQGFQTRNGGAFANSGNYTSATAAMFVDAAYNGGSDQTLDLHIVNNAATQANVIDLAAALSGVTDDFDGQARASSGNVDRGADELQAAAAAPEIHVSGNGQTINDGDTTPALADHSDFGSVDVAAGSVIRTFTIHNSGTAALTIGGVTIGGAQAGDFTVTANPPGSIAAGGFATFQVTFNPSAAGTRSATVSIANNDGDENTYNFAIRGAGTSVTEPEGSILGIFRKGKWHWDANRNGLLDDGFIQYAKKGYAPIVGNWDGNGDDDLGLFRRGRFILDANDDGILNDATIKYGKRGDKPLVGDWDGDDRDDIGVYRGNGKVYLDDGDGIFNDAFFLYGQTGDKPIVGDWDGDGTDDIGVFRKGRFFLDANVDQVFNDPAIVYGQKGYVPVIGDWDGDGTDDLGVYRRGKLYVDLNLDHVFNDAAQAFGKRGDRVVTGVME